MSLLHQTDKLFYLLRYKYSCTFKRICVVWCIMSDISMIAKLLNIKKTQAIYQLVNVLILVWWNVLRNHSVIVLKRPLIFLKLHTHTWNQLYDKSHDIDQGTPITYRSGWKLNKTRIVVFTKTFVNIVLLQFHQSSNESWYNCMMCK